MQLSQQGLDITRYFTERGSHPFLKVHWEKRDAVILGQGGKPAFEARGVEFPAEWSQRATDIVASKYFRVVNGERETSVKQMLTRVVDRVAEWGLKDGYFDDSTTFAQELAYILLHQLASFNSPVWFNVGVQAEPQTSACFILDVEDNMESILDWVKTEGMIFKGGSGAGVNLSKLRAKHTPLSSGGTASGPVSFMRLADAGAGVIKSGGGTRRAAKMVILNATHPDIREFIWSKAHAERMARNMVQLGYTDGLEDEVRQTVPFQNANNSVSVTETFMATVSADSGSVQGTLLKEIAQATHECGDPGLFFHDTVNAWHTTPGLGEIVSSNPCAEFLRPPNSSCNLASLNLLKFLKDDDSFDIPAFKHTVDVLITAMDILIDHSSYPTDEIAKNSRDYRPLGLGYANLGALLMSKGLAYDSEEGRDYAASITALMTGEAYAQSGRLANLKGGFKDFESNREAMFEVINKHDSCVMTQSGDMQEAIMETWLDCLAAREFRNCQVTVLAPTGTISFMMDCDTTGAEPCLGLVTRKKLVGGGEMTLVNSVVHRALKALGYEESETAKLCAALYDGKPFMGRTEHDPVFATALGSNTISWQGHLKMVAAVQPFISGGVSKTINMPAESTVQDVYDAFVMAWRLGLKAVSIYRDGCKGVQPVTVEKQARYEEAVKLVQDMPRVTTTEDDFPPFGYPAQRRRLPDERPAINHKFSVDGHEGYITVGLYGDGTPGELFIRMAKEGSTIAGLMDTIGILTSLLLQHGAPLKVLTDKLTGTRFEPAGVTGNKDIFLCKSIVDYVFRWMHGKFDARGAARQEIVPETAHARPHQHTDAPLCSECGTLMTQRTGSCFVCDNCGSSAGCS